MLPFKILQPLGPFERVTPSHHIFALESVNDMFVCKSSSLRISGLADPVRLLDRRISFEGRKENVIPSERNNVELLSIMLCDGDV